MLFSIVTVTYNAEKTLPRTLQSILTQTFHDFEHIIVDGASTDKTLELIANYKSQTTNYKSISEPDSGLYDAMNKGLQLATGDYVLFLNAGDTFHSKDILQKIHSQLSTLHSPFSVLYGETDIVDKKGNFIAHRRLQAPEQLTWKSFRMGMLVCHQSFIVRREIAEPFDLHYRYSADFEWCIRCLKKAETVHNTHLIISNYLCEGISTTNRKVSLKERFEIMVQHYGWLPTVLRHLWFAVRFYVAKILRKQI
jgi:glycosyltransferase involved in cell wall biosynthesis